MILRLVPAAIEARLSIRASDGPIFPATPRMSTSPGMRRRVSMTPAVGALSRSSSLSVSGMLLTEESKDMTERTEYPEPQVSRKSGAEPLDGVSRRMRRMTERGDRQFILLLRRAEIGPAQEIFLMSRLALCPPKPKLFDMP
jgi:hypothetical protein